MSKTQDYQKRIADKLAFLESKLKQYGCLHLYDENIAMEDVICRLLNLFYGYELVNLNIQKENYPGIDLGDKKNRLAVQVTSNSSRDKVKETIHKFHDYKLAEQYDRLVIFVLEPRKSFSKEFEPVGFSFSPKDDILDFTSLTRALLGLKLDRLVQIDRYLEQEFPLEQINRYLEQEIPQRRPHPWMFIVGVAFVLAVTLCLFASHNAQKDSIDSGAEMSPVGGNSDRMPTFTYETNMDWLRMDEAAAVLGTDSQVYVYKPKYGNEYFQCAVLTALYSNYSEHDRCITEFTVYADDIHEDLSPDIVHEAFESDNTLQFHCTNIGWSETGDFTIEYVGITPVEKSDKHNCVDVVVDPDAVSSWNYPSIEPGEEKYISLFNTSDIQITHKKPFNGSIQFEIMFRLYSKETGYEAMLPCWVYISADYVSFQYGANGKGDEKNYVVWVETSEPQWQETYKVQQWLPGNETVRLPIFIVPEKSCTMTIRIEFKTADGEIIQAMPLENARFVVPYYGEEPWEYVDGKLLDWSQIDGDEVFCFPFSKTDKIVAKPVSRNEDISDNGQHFIGSVTPMAENAVPISTAQELVDKLTADPNGSYYLTCDIDLSLYNGGTWNSLPLFKGMLDGQGHVIRNFSCITYNNAGLFKNVKDAVFKNLGIEALVISAQDNAGVVAGTGSASLSNCYVTCLQLGSEGNIGGLIGSGDVVLEDVYVDVSIHAQPEAEYSAFLGSSSVSCCAGGIVGYGSVEASNITVHSDISIIGKGDPGSGNIRTGGLIGDSGSATKISLADSKVDCCIYVKTVEDIEWETMSDGRRRYKGVHVYAGGLVGEDTHSYGSGHFVYDNSVAVSNCDLTVDIDLDVYGTATAGGFIGTESGMNSSGVVVTIDNCQLTGTIDAHCLDGTASSAGGCFGYHPDSTEENTVAINNTQIQCKVTAQGGYYTTRGGALSSRGNAGIVITDSSVNVDLDVIPGFGVLYIEGEEQ